MQQPKLISFDGDDTLWDFRIMMRRGTEAVAAAISHFCGEDYAHVNYGYLVKRQKAFLMSLDIQTVNYLEARRELFRVIMHEEHHTDPVGFADQLIQIYVEARDARYEVFPDAHLTLEALKSRYKLAYITNGTTYPETVGLHQYFDVVVNCDDHIGMRKPRAEVFEFTAQQAGVDISEMLHVGDNIVADVGGAIWAKAQGGIWFNPHGDSNGTKITPTAEIDSLGEVLNLLNH